MSVRIIAFARIREILGEAELERELATERSTAQTVWDRLADEFPALRELGASTRFARNGVFVASSSPLADGDELALLPPSGGG